MNEIGNSPPPPARDRAPACTARVCDPETHELRACRCRGRAMVTLVGVVTVRQGPLCGAHLESVRARFGRVLERVERILPPAAEG